MKKTLITLGSIIGGVALIGLIVWHYWPKEKTKIASSEITVQITASTTADLQSVLVFMQQEITTLNEAKK